MSLPKHSAALDGLRGVAVSLVIASHAFPVVRELPWAIKRFSNLGFFGVQLFFVVSALTLAASWRRAERQGTPDLAGFALRRVFRIAPAYFLAALLYAWLHHAHALPLTRLITFVTFTSGWSPGQMPTAPGAYTVVPGGWSIEAEFAFYAIFPALMAALTTWRRTALALAVSLPAAWAANAAALDYFPPIYGQAATDQFLYYWLPNQLPVFLCGLLAYQAASRADAMPWRPGFALAGACLGFMALAFVPWPRLPAPGHALLSSPMLAAACFAVATLAALRKSPRVLTHALVVRLGQASFSAYLVHFAVLDAVRAMLPVSVREATGLRACMAAPCVFAVTLVTTALVGQITYRAVELPCIRLGGRLAEAARGRAMMRAAPVSG